MMMGNGNSINPNTYDENGNILQMQQWGIAGTVSQQIDNLLYTYGAAGGVSNKLLKVKDNGIQPAANIGDFNNKNTGDNDDYGYDVNGNMITDKNKDIGGSTGIDLASGGAIEYNHLNLPYLITVAGKGTIKYIYDATGNKLEKRTNEPAQNKNTKTDYLAGYIYENDKLQFFGHEEGRVRETVDANNTVTGYSFDYFIKDHLGNVRMVLTDGAQQNVYPAATLEGDIAVNGVPNAINLEKDYYTINTGNVVDKPAAMPSSINKNGGSSSLDAPVNNNPNSDVTANSQKVYQLEASSSGGVTGLGVTLKVMAGDRMDVHGKSYWQDNNASGNNYNVLLAEIIGGLLGTPGGATAGKGATVSLLTTGASPTILPSSFLSRTPPPGDQKPMAYINWILFDEQFKYVNGSFSRVGDGNTIKDHFAELQNITVNKNGYLYVYCSNQSPAKVFFDNLQVIHTKSPLVEETHYYPFGLTMARISSKAAGFLTNKYKFGAKELNSNEFSDGSGLELYDFAARNFDPQIGRWWSNDPKADKSVGISPYNYCFNNPIKFFDPDGKFPYTFIVRSYEHSNIFASPLTSLGDGRNATTSSDATARIHYRMNVETNGNKLENYRAWSSPTIQLVNPISPVSGPLVDLAHPKYNASSDGRGNYSFDAAAPNPVASKMVPILGKLMTPDIDIKGNMSITEKNGTLNIKGQINGDGFPDAETFIKDNSGQALMLGTYNHGEMASPFWSLEGDGNKKMIDVNMQVQLDKNGNFSKAWSIDSKGHKTRLSIVAPEKD
jgi:RHS repeat-associated protein